MTLRMLLSFFWKWRYHLWGFFTGRSSARKGDIICLIHVWKVWAPEKHSFHHILVIYLENGNRKKTHGFRFHISNTFSGQERKRCQVLWELHRPCFSEAAMGVPGRDVRDYLRWFLLARLLLWRSLPVLAASSQHDGVVSKLASCWDLRTYLLIGSSFLCSTGQRVPWKTASDFL